MITSLLNIDVSKMGENALAMAHSASLMLPEIQQTRCGSAGLVNFLPQTLPQSDLPFCPFAAPPVCDTEMKYRTIQGECNNLKKPFFGMSFTPLARVLDSAFEDGIEEIRSTAKNGEPLASARVISTTIRGITRNQGATQKPSDDFTALFVAFAQFVDHDTDHVPIQGM